MARQHPCGHDGCSFTHHDEAVLQVHRENVHRPRAPLPTIGPRPAAPPARDDDLTWEDPPGRAGSLEREVRPIVERLARRPGKWARILTYDQPKASQSKGTALRRLFAECEFKTGAFGTGSAVWACYVGPTPG